MDYLFAEIECECPECDETFHHEFQLSNKDGGPGITDVRSKVEKINCEHCEHEFKIHAQGDVEVQYD